MVKLHDLIRFHQNRTRVVADACWRDNTGTTAVTEEFLRSDPSAGGGRRERTKAFDVARAERSPRAGPMVADPAPPANVLSAWQEPWSGCATERNKGPEEDWGALKQQHSCVQPVVVMYRLVFPTRAVSLLILNHRHLIHHPGQSRTPGEPPTAARRFLRGGETSSSSSSSPLLLPTAGQARGLQQTQIQRVGSGEESSGVASHSDTKGRLVRRYQIPRGKKQNVQLVEMEYRFGTSDDIAPRPECIPEAARLSRRTEEVVGSCH
ncbi:hypothetical protein EYF80_037312 [Liparis tanakae]|uniref:Uncharacterized protein n=1 Tax=Liparis tanakae TaxID=230148 RepID=A0A4Z2GH71_9TELE|nr:hypothetical protein EYF80_037312 [Liparis tanakae]